MLIRNWQVVLQTWRFLCLSFSPRFASTRLRSSRKDIDQWNLFAFIQSRLVQSEERKIAKEMNITTLAFLIISFSSLPLSSRKERRHNTSREKHFDDSSVLSKILLSRWVRQLQKENVRCSTTSVFFASTFLLLLLRQSLPIFSLNKQIFSISMTRWSVVGLQTLFLFDNDFHSSDRLMAKQELIDPLAYYTNP